MRKKFDNFVSTMVILVTFCWPLCFLVPMFYNSVNTTTELYTTTCEVTDKYETQVSKYDSALSLLSKSPVFRPQTEYILVVEHKGEGYEIKVEEEMYNKVKIGELVECEVKFTHNNNSQEENYKVSILKEN